MSSQIQDHVQTSLQGELIESLRLGLCNTKCSLAMYHFRVIVHSANTSETWHLLNQIVRWKERIIRGRHVKSM